MNDHFYSKDQQVAEGKTLLNFIQSYVGGDVPANLQVGNGINTLSGIVSRAPNCFVLFRENTEEKTWSIEYLSNHTDVGEEQSSSEINELIYNHIGSESVRATLSQVDSSNESFHHIIPLSSDNNGLIWCECYFSRFAAGEVLGAFRDVSEMISVFNDFDRNKKNLEQLRENLPIGLFQTDATGKLDFVNRWFARMLGQKSIKMLLKSGLGEYFSDSELFNFLYEKILKGERVKETEVKLKHPSKKEIWAVISIQGIFDDNNKLINIDGYIYDITDRKSALEKLRESEQMFRAISQSLNGALYMFDESGKFIYCNQATYDITGFSKEEVLVKKFFDIVHPDFRDKIKNRGIKRLEGKSVPKSYEIKIITKSGEEKWLEVHASKIVLKSKPVILGLANDITSRRTALEVIQRSEEKYKTLYSFFRLMADNVPDMIWAKNLNNEYIFANKALCSQLLMASNIDEPIGKTDNFFVDRERRKHKDDPQWHTFGELCPNSDEIILLNKRYQTFEEYGTIKGKYVYLDVHKAPLVDESGEIIGTVGSARNVTHQRILEEDRARDERIKNVVYRISNAIRTTKDLNELYTVIRLELGNVINTTNLYIALYDEKTDMLSLPYFVDERDRFSIIPARKTLTRFLIRQDKPLLLKESDYMDLVKEGKVELTGTPAKVWLGVPLHINEDTYGAIVVQNYKDESAFTHRDLELLEFVSAQISVSIHQKQADDVLRENEFMLREIIDSVPMMVFAKDKHQRFVLANKAFASAYGKRVGEIEGRLQSEIHPVPAEIEKFRRDDEKLLQQKSKRLETEESFTYANGDAGIIRTVKVPFNSETEKGIAILGVAIDITETKNYEIELKTAKNKAEESDKLKTAFLANMSHEIRTPMNAIIGFSELLNDPDLMDDTRREFIGLIADNSRILLNLIEDIIDVAKIEAQQVKIVRASCQVNVILDELRDYYVKQLSKFPHKSIEIVVEKSFASEDFSVITDPLRLRQILNNLIGNAIKFTDTGQVLIGYCLKDKETLEFFVQDTGIGLASEKKELIFERFRQAEESSTKEYGGTGLGLTISKRLIEMLGGKIGVDSKLQEGSRFYFTIPFRPTKEGLETKLFRPQSDKQDWSGKTILVAEDESSNFELIKATLHRTNVRLLRAENGKEAVDICHNNKDINLILMDIRMPVMNGYEATRIIKATNQKLPIISLTAYAMSDDKDKSFNAGCDEYVAKPFNPIDLLEKISRYLH